MRQRSTADGTEKVSLERQIVTTKKTDCTGTDGDSRKAHRAGVYVSWERLSMRQRLKRRRGKRLSRHGQSHLVQLYAKDNTTAMTF